MGGDPVNFIDPSGLETNAVTANLEGAAFGISVTAGAGYVWDGGNNSGGIIVTVGAGGGSPNLSASINYEENNANSMHNLNGWGSEAGGSIGLVDYSRTYGLGYYGQVYGPSVSFRSGKNIPGSVNGLITYTIVIDIDELNKALCGAPIR